MHDLLTQLTKAPEPCKSITNRKSLWLAHTGVCVTTTVFGVRQTEMFHLSVRTIYSLVSLSVTPGTMQYTLLLAGWFSRMPLCKNEGKEFKKSTSSKVIWIMKPELPFINDKNVTYGFWSYCCWTKSVSHWSLYDRLSQTLYSPCMQKFAHFHIPCQIISSLRNVCQDQIKSRMSEAALKHDSSSGAISIGFLLSVVRIFGQGVIAWQSLQSC